ncbi:hypothetical protein WBP06_18290 (plasmid) [Novosphingobium sp. BL-8H]|uniref:hypothetical protein n=1 Tax=Novosphingobium sp. BL-8H TaxID=3127640 RepID=UPI00375713B3
MVRSTSLDVVDIISRRMQDGVTRMARQLSADALKEIAGTADFPGMLIAILRHMPAVDPIESHVIEQISRTIAFKARLVEGAGGVLTAEGVQKLFGYKSVQAVHKAVASRRLFAVDDNGRKLFPAFQFDGASVASGIPAVLAATPTVSPWALLQFFVYGHEGLGDEQPTQMVNADPETVARLVRFASALEV